MNCDDFISLIHAKADGGLGPLDESSLSVHLKTCQACESRLARALRLKDLLSRAAALPLEARPRPWFEPQFWAALKNENKVPSAKRLVRSMPVLAGLVVAAAAVFHYSPMSRWTAPPPLVIVSGNTEESLALMDASRTRAKAALERQRVNERSRETLDNLF